MADIDEEPHINHGTSADEDYESGDEAQDFLLLASLTSKSNSQLPKRGDKDFERHGTRHQDNTLAASRRAMHDVLDYTRTHNPRTHIRGFYYGIESFSRDEVVPKEWRQGLEDDHVVVLESWKGPHFKTMGKHSLGQKHSSLWLLPEEALYLIERGNLDLWWPSISSFKGVVEEGEDKSECKSRSQLDQEEKDEGLPMSLQAAYSMLIGEDNQKGKIGLERYTVYVNLKRIGYMVCRAPEWDPIAPALDREQVARASQESQNIFNWLFGKLFAEEKVTHSLHGPLVKPGMYRSFNSIYRQIAIVPRHKPSALPHNLTATPELPYRVVFDLWKPSRIAKISKTNPGPPDFRMAIADARFSTVPNLAQMTSLLESTKLDPPSAQLVAGGPGRTYQRIQHGWRNVLLAVVDQGIISYLRLSETAFGEEEMYDRGIGQGTKRGNHQNSRGQGGRGGRGIGRGRGRGRGREGRRGAEGGK